MPELAYDPDQSGHVCKYCGKPGAIIPATGGGWVHSKCADRHSRALHTRRTRKEHQVFIVLAILTILGLIAGVIAFLP